jgi:hypothetical protein
VLGKSRDQHATPGRPRNPWTTPASSGTKRAGITEIRSWKTRISGFSGPFGLPGRPARPLRTRSRSCPDGRRSPTGWKPGAWRPRPGPKEKERRERLPEKAAGSRAGARPGPHPEARPGSTFGEGDGGVLGVDGVEDALVADLRLGNKADLAADVRGAPAHGAAAAAAAAAAARREGDPGPLGPLRTPALSVGAYSSRLRPNMAAGPAPLPSPSLPPSHRGAAAAGAAAAAARGMLGGRGRSLARLCEYGPRPSLPRGSR